MSDILQIRFGQAGADQGLTESAETVFQNVGWHNSNLFLYDEFTQAPNVIAVGFKAEAPVVAASMAEKIEEGMSGVDYSPETQNFLDVPYLAIQGLASASEFRKRGHATQTIKAVLKLAAETGFHHVSASDVVEPTVRFWRNRRFVQPPRLPFSDDLVRETSVPIGALAAVIEVEPSVIERLREFSSQDLYASVRRQQ